MAGSGSLAPGTTVTVAGVDAKIMVDGYSKAIDERGGPSREVIYLVPWDQSDTFMDGLRGTSKVTGGPGGVVTRPAFHRYPNNENLISLSCRAEPLGVPRPDTVNGRLFAADFARVTVLYGVPAFDYAGTNNNIAFGGVARPFAEYRVRSYTETVPVPKSAVHLVKADTTTEDLGVSIKRNVLCKEYNLTIHYFPFLPEAILDPLVNKVNEAEFWGKDIGTWMFAEWDADQQPDADGTQTLQLQLRFLWREEEWNKEPLSDSLEWGIVEDDDGETRYLYDDFNVFLTL